MKKKLYILLVFLITITLASCVTVELNLDCQKVTLGVGEEYEFTYTTLPVSLKEDMEIKVTSEDNSIASITSNNKVLGVSPGVVVIVVEDSEDSYVNDVCEFTIVDRDISNNDTIVDLIDVITEPEIMDLTDDAYLTYILSDHGTEYEFYYMQLNIDNDTYVIEFALKDSETSVYETGSLSDASGSYEIERLNQPSGFDEFWGFNLVGNNMELYILYYYDDGSFVVSEFDPMIFIPN